MSNLTAQRGAIPIELDKPRLLFFDAGATFLLFDRYGMGFASALYSVVETGGVDAEGKPQVDVRLKSVEVLQYFLWAALQPQCRETKEVIDLDEIGDFIRPWTLPAIFTAVMQAFTGALYVSPVKEGKDEAAPAKRPSRKVKTPKKASTSKTPSGLRSQR